MAPVSASILSPSDRASFATSSRLLSCLIAESLLKAIFVPACDISLKHFVGTAIVLTSTASKRNRPYSPDDIFAIIPLRRIPVFKARCKNEIGLLDPLDMLPCVYELLDNGHPQQNDSNINVCKLCCLLVAGSLHSIAAFLGTFNPIAPTVFDPVPDAVPSH